MDKIEKILIAMKNSPQNVRYADLLAVCRAFFGEPRQRGNSHTVFKMSWQGDPRINIQKSGDKPTPIKCGNFYLPLKNCKGNNDEPLYLPCFLER